VRATVTRRSELAYKAPPSTTNVLSASCRQHRLRLEKQNGASGKMPAALGP